jgi:putative Mg2+ transporter-C (MgtC) family protein
LISVRSALFTIISLIFGDLYGGDYARIAAAVVSGVGFLGAGAVVKDGVNVSGLTTAASIWLVASLGMGAGIGEYELVLAIAGGMLVVLWLFPYFERWIDNLHDFLEIKISIPNKLATEVRILELLKEIGVKVVYVRRSRPDKSTRVLHIKLKTKPADRSKLSVFLAEDKDIIAFDG